MTLRERWLLHRYPLYLDWFGKPHPAVIVRCMRPVRRRLPRSRQNCRICDAVSGASGRNGFLVRPPHACTALLRAQADGEEQKSAVGNQFAGRVGLFLRVDDFASMYDHMRQHGVDFVTQPREESYGQSRCSLMSPGTGGICSGLHGHRRIGRGWPEREGDRKPPRTPPMRRVGSRSLLWRFRLVRARRRWLPAGS